MSTAVMAACWPLQMPPAPKSVLMSLADNANDHGECWPSIDTIAQRTCLHRATVIRSIETLEKMGRLTADRTNGRKTRYVITLSLELFPNQSHGATGSTARPVAQRDPSHSATRRTARPVDSNNQHVTGTRRTVRPVAECDTNQEQEQKKNQKQKHAPNGAELISDVSPNVVADFLKIRRAKRLPLTSIAVEALRREAAKAGMTLEQALTKCCEKTWAGFEARWLNNEANGHAPPAPGTPRQRRALGT